MIERNDSLPAAKCKFGGMTASERGRRKTAHPRNPGEFVIELCGQRGDN